MNPRKRDTTTAMRVIGGLPQQALASSATHAALSLRGGDAAALSAVISVGSNTLAIVLMAAFMQRLKKDMSRSEELLYTALCGFMTYMIVYAVSGFVPMGYVAGSSPLFTRLFGALR